MTPYKMQEMVARALAELINTPEYLVRISLNGHKLSTDFTLNSEYAEDSTEPPLPWISLLQQLMLV